MAHGFGVGVASPEELTWGERRHWRVPGGSVVVPGWSQDVVAGSGLPAQRWQCLGAVGSGRAPGTGPSGHPRTVHREGALGAGLGPGRLPGLVQG